MLTEINVVITTPDCNFCQWSTVQVYRSFCIGSCDRIFTISWSTCLWCIC